MKCGDVLDPPLDKIDEKKMGIAMFGGLIACFLITIFLCMVFYGNLDIKIENCLGKYSESIVSIGFLVTFFSSFIIAEIYEVVKRKTR